MGPSTDSKARFEKRQNTPHKGKPSRFFELDPEAGGGLTEAQMLFVFEYYEEHMISGDDPV